MTDTPDLDRWADDGGPLPEEPMSDDRRKLSPVDRLWLDYYLSSDGHCSLCGNWGVIDTTGTKTPAGWEVGRLNWCICPNGSALRAMHHPLLPAAGESYPVPARIVRIGEEPDGD